MSKRIVVAEDFNVSRKIIASTLTKEGYSVMAAADGAEALDLFDGRPVDLLITDFNMPNLSGAELIQQVRSIIGYKYMPILLLTNEVRQDKLRQATDGSTIAHVKKPFEKAEFLEIVKRALK